MSYEIKPGLSIGQIQLGMDRNKVNELITELEEWKDTPYGYKKEVIYDCDKYADTAGVKASKRMMDAAGVRYHQYHRTGRKIEFEI